MEFVEYTLEGAVGIIKLNRPPVNALSPDLGLEIVQACELASDPAVRSVIIWGEPHFAAGADIKGFGAAQAGGPGGDEQLARSIADAVLALESLAKPTIAAVMGYALGGGLELAMGADFRFLAEDAKVGQPEINLGLIPGAGGTVRLPRLVGFQKAKEMVYSGRHVGAEEALAAGLADKVGPKEALFNMAMSEALRWASAPTVGIGAAKQSLTQGWGKSLQEALDIEAESFKQCFWSEDAIEGVSAFVEKREAQFTGT